MEWKHAKCWKSPIFEGKLWVFISYLIKGAFPIFVINLYRTTRALLINGPQVQRFVQEILPVLQSWADQNKKEIGICGQYLEKMLIKVYPGRQIECNNSSQPKIDHKKRGKWSQWGDSKGRKRYPRWQESRKWDTGMWL